jgi:lysophospholipase L1-like esterase
MKSVVVCLFWCFKRLLVGCATQKSESRRQRALYNLFRDSITFGYGASIGEDYPTALAKMVKLPVVNAGVDGDTSFAALARIEQDVLSKNPILVIVEFCGNDFLKKIPRETTVKNLGEIIDRIQEKGAMVALVDISAGLFFEYGQLSEMASQKSDIRSVVCTRFLPSAMKSDFFPNARGYKT